MKEDDFEFSPEFMLSSYDDTTEILPEKTTPQEGENVHNES